MENIFKIEKKHDKWMVTLEKGEYSDYSKEVIIILAGIVWGLVKVEDSKLRGYY